MVVVKSSSSVKSENVDVAKNTKIQWLINEKDGANKFFMRLFTVEPNGYSPLHTHNWEHEVFILTGEGKIVLENKEISFKERDVIFVPCNEKHQFVNTGNSNLEFLCSIPKVD